MFKHILLPTDGSQLAEQAVIKGIEFARVMGARVTACHVAGHNDLTRVYVGSGAVSAKVGAKIEQAFEDQVHTILSFASSAAEKAGVPCATRYVNSPDCFAAIIQTAEGEGCDLIFMGSHGRSGMTALVLGSITNKVLTHSKIPVVVCR